MILNYGIDSGVVKGESGSTQWISSSTT